MNNPYKRRGAHVTVMTSADKAKEIIALGAKETIGRDDPFPDDAFDSVVDLVVGPRWPDMISALRRGGRYIAAGAIAGPIVELDVRTLYLRHFTLFGSTSQPDNILIDVISYIEREEVRPMIAQELKFEDLRKAQEAFLEKGAHRENRNT